ncbi:ABC transporter ATP-binding protein [Sinorhizobium meliloti]|uniref:ABC transporter, ATP-binding protein n=1 Tax=Rhizobium meliloti (strain 1021) TaxID=266834 RepID=Q92XV5_RHIME|nr:oligopeptide/dipeptide ABC transporter ATP-binding protein [Sinorhizobium meliloti]TWA88615.1 peptide/nickel transport system ATP-binding protein [Ensifer sp. SEMIA 134]TWB26578.1 peptide/nickel transport system ATP-binding protein [Ensifer sp. SEMIA 135]AAK65793.1 ABC transporter, ATP-binding protein [Sinorhizobium meliloti 1021]AEG58163.1 oligopeptide/dipeptide ABC transporter, ATPase subunit [Sinorhizobium meliloti AK83]AGG70834.1 ABC transporter,ATP-binding protein [Sinorhizobium melilo
MPLISASNLKTHYKTRDGLLRSVDGVDLVVERGETVGLVGESGCGKSTLGKTLLRLVDPTAGRIEFKGEDITALDQGRLRNVRKSIQMIFQDPFASLNPRHTIGEILEAPLIVHQAGSPPERRSTVASIVAKVGLPADAINRYPHEFSGGQRQRIGIARALLLNPELIVCDEPVSALDLSIQAQILNLLVEMKKEFGLSYLFISHDLSVVRYFCDRVLVMYLGRVVESADNETLWSDPRHPYTRALMAAVPDPSRPRQAAPLGGELPSPSNIPPGCRFHTRCPLATELCRVAEPEFRSIKPGHRVACHVADHIN